MQETNKSFRIKYDQNNPIDHLNVKIDQDFDFMEVLSMKITQEDVYRTYTSNYGVVVGRVLANDGFGIPNAKISIFFPNNSIDPTLDSTIIFPFKTTADKDSNNIRYNLLPSQKINACYQNVGTMPSKRDLLDNDSKIEVFENFYNFTTTTNESGDYMFFGVPIGTQNIHVDIDLSDIGVLSQTPRDMMYKGYGVKQFDSPNKFKTSTNLDSLPQIISQDTTIFVYPFWGDETQGEIAISKKTINIQYKFEPTCVFMGSIFTDSVKGGIGKTCMPSKHSGVMGELTTSQGSIEMIRKKLDQSIENYDINGTRLINNDGVWCYQIPMNLDYVITDEYGNLTPTTDPTKGIPTRTSVRFKITLDDNGDDFSRTKTGVYLIPNNPSTQTEEDYIFNQNCKSTSFVDLMWNKVYSVKSYIPRINKSGVLANIASDRRFNGLKSINYHGSNNPTPYNNIWVDINLRFVLLCSIFTLLIKLIGLINRYIIGPLHVLDWTGLVDNLSPIILNANILGESSDCIQNTIGAEISFFAPQYRGGVESELSKHQISMGILHGLSENYDLDYKIRSKNRHCFPGWDGGGYPGNIIEGTTKWAIQIKQDGSNMVGCSSDLKLSNYLDLSIPSDLHENGHYWYKFKTSFVAVEAPGEGRYPNLTNNILDCIISELAIGSNVVNFDFTNDWLNGSLYAPRFIIKNKKNRKNGVTTPVFCGSWGTYPYSYLYLVQTCSTPINKDGSYIGEHSACDNGKCYKQYSKKPITRGIIKKNMSDNTFYYRSIEFPTAENSLIKYIQPTEIILLGGLLDCDPDGIPQLHRLLPSTSFKLPPDLTETGQTQTNISENELTGLSWGDDDTKKTNGLFVGIDCTKSTTYAKTCINANRLCEIGVDFDERYDITGNTLVSIYPDGYISYDEISDGDSRAMFSTLNFNNLKTITNKYNQTKYDFTYNYPVGFDGKLRADTVNGLLNTDLLNTDYYNFRFGLNSDGVGYDYSSGYYSFPRYENSFYFYFGLKPGFTALDQFNTQYFVPCSNIESDKFILNLEIVSGESICIGNDAIIGITTYKTIFPFNIYIDNILYEPNIETDNEILITGLTSKYYDIKIIDGNNNVVTRSIFIPKSSGISYNISTTNPTVNGYFDGSVIISNIINENSNGNVYNYSILDIDLSTHITGNFIGDSFTYSELSANYGGYEISIYQPDCAANIFTSIFYMYGRPQINTQGPILINKNNAMLKSQAITTEKEPTIIEGGFYISTGNIPSIINELGVSGITTFDSYGMYYYLVDKLTVGTTYYYQPWAINSIGIGYGDIFNFTTDSGTTASLQITDISGITTNSATLTTNFTDYGGVDVLSYGVCYNTYGFPTTGDSKTINAGFNIFDAPISEYITILTDLSGATNYYASPYSINDYGVAYGDISGFTTTV